MDQDQFRVSAGHMRLDNVAEEAFSALEASGIDSILLKGPAITRLLYPHDPESRRYGDVDLLIDPTTYEQARVALEALGFLPRFPKAGLNETGLYAIEFERRDIMIDLHVRYPGLHVNGSDIWQALSNQTEPFMLRHRTVRALRPAAQMLMIALHTLKSGIASTNQDLVRAVNCVPLSTWEQTAALADQLGGTSALALALDSVEGGAALARQLGMHSALLPDDVLQASGPPPIALGVNRLVETIGIRPKLALAIRELVPTPDGLRYWSPLARSGPRGLVAAYLWRPFWLLWHLPPAVRAVVRSRRKARKADGRGFSRQR